MLARLALLLAGVLAVSGCDSPTDPATTAPDANKTSEQAAPAVQEEVPKGESAKLQGAWRVVGLEAGGRKAPEASLKEQRFLIEGDKISLSGKPEDLRAYRLDATAKPRAVDIPGSVEKEFSKAIYGVEGDTLKLCFSQSTEVDRPKDFNTAGTKYLCFTLKREKP